MDSSQEKIKKKTVLGYELSYRQDAWVNYLIPSLSACILYMLLIASDIATIYSHFKNGDPIWGFLTIFFMYLPVLTSFILIVSNWELWPEFEGCGRENIIWFWTKVVEHLLFPVWSMWRFAERIFWSIEAVRAQDEYSAKEIFAIVNSPRSIELYIFLQSYVHSLPQVILQFYILIRHNTNIKHETAEAQVLSIVFNLLKISVTTTYYQRFRSQKLTGKQYPWYKVYKHYNQKIQEQKEEVVLRRPIERDTRTVLEDRRITNQLEDLYDLETPKHYSEHRRSSDLYLVPSTSNSSSKRVTQLEDLYNLEPPKYYSGHRISDNYVVPSTSEGSKRLLETDFDTYIITKAKSMDSDDPVDTSTSKFGRETSVLDGPQRRIFREIGISEPDFNVSRVVPYKGLENDDFAGQLVATLWWFSFLLTRVIAISMSAYFFSSATIYLILAHFIFVISVLLYDVKSDEIKRDKTLFFIFIGYVYIFCIIEFKIRFKKATAVYYGFFALVFAENFGMCLAWYIDRVEYLENDFWCRYAFYLVIIGTITSFSSMVFYLIVNKPNKVEVGIKILQPKH